MLKHVLHHVNCRPVTIRLATRTFYPVQTELPPLVTSDWLQTQLERENVKIVDGSMHLPAANRDAAKEFSQQRITGATFFDHNEICDKRSKYTRMMPTAQEFEVHMSQIGLKQDDIVIVYDTLGIFSSPRVWYMLKSLGAKHVAVLDGGFPLWKKQMRPIEEGPMTGGYQTETKAFSAKLNKQSIASLRDVSRILTGVEGEDIQIVDARSTERYLGKEDEGQGMQRGHIPGAISVPHTRLLNIDGITFRSPTELMEVFRRAKVDVTKPVISTCGSGVTAAKINFALYMIQWDQLHSGELDEMADELQPMRLYDGSWAEWGSIPTSPVSSEEHIDDSTTWSEIEYKRGPLDYDK